MPPIDHAWTLLKEEKKRYVCGTCRGWPYEHPNAPGEMMDCPTCLGSGEVDDPNWALSPHGGF